MCKRVILKPVPCESWINLTAPIKYHNIIWCTLNCSPFVYFTHKIKIKMQLAKRQKPWISMEMHIEAFRQAPCMHKFYLNIHTQMNQITQRHFIKHHPIRIKANPVHAWLPVMQRVLEYWFEFESNGLDLNSNGALMQRIWILSVLGCVSVWVGLCV